MRVFSTNLECRMIILNQMKFANVEELVRYSRFFVHDALAKFV